MASTSTFRRLPSSSAVNVLDEPLYVLGLAFLVVGVPILVFSGSPMLGFVLCFLFGVAMTNFAVAAVPVVLAAAFLFQNAFVAYITPSIEVQSTFNMVRGQNFVLLAAMWGMLVLARLTEIASKSSATDELDKSLLISFGLLAVIVFYLAIGISKQPENALTYLRNIAGPLLCFQIGLMAARRGARHPERALMVLGWMALAYGYLEFLFDLRFLSLFNGDAYLNWKLLELKMNGYWLNVMKGSGYVVRDELDMMRVTLLNSSLLKDLEITVFRPNGPNFHPISFAYALTLFGLVGLARGRIALLIASLPLLLIVGSKGALILIFFAGGAMLLSRRGRNDSLLFGVMAALFVFLTVAIIVGLRGGDYHVLGLIGSIKGFLSNPLGHGIGVGGNLGGTLTAEQWQAAQHSGETAVALESGIGVLLFQMGVGAIALIAFYASIVKRCWQVFGMTGDRLAALSTFTLLTLLANGLLQEEAMFAPLALGVTLLLAGIALGRNNVPQTS